MNKNQHIPPGFKQSSIGPIPNNWEVRKLGEICPIFKSGQGITSKNIADKGEYPVYGGNGLRGYTNKYTHIGRYILIGRQGALCGNVLLINGKNYISEHAIAVQSDSNNDLNFLAYKLDYLNLNRFSESSAQPGLSVEKLTQQRIALPPLHEQTAIANLLSTWDKAIETTQKLVAQKELRKKWLMQMLLTKKKRVKGFYGEWKEGRLEETLERLKNGLTYNPNNLQGIPVTRIETISNGIIDHSKVGFADYSDIIKEYKLIKGDILFSHINSISHIGKVAIYNDDLPIYHGMNLLLFRTNKTTNSEFLYYWLCSQNAQKIFKSLAKQAVNQASINTKEIKKIYIKLPELGEQIAIVNILSSSDNEIGLLKTKLEKLKEHKKGLMQVLLTGRKRLKI